MSSRADVEVVQIPFLHENRVGVEDIGHAGDTETNQRVRVYGVERFLVDRSGDFAKGIKRTFVLFLPEGEFRGRIEIPKKAVHTGVHQAVGRDFLEIVLVYVTGNRSQVLIKFTVDCLVGGGARLWVGSGEQDDNWSEKTKHGHFLDEAVLATALYFWCPDCRPVPII